MSDGYFKHFLEVLDEVEAQKPKEWQERKLRTIPEIRRVDICQERRNKLRAIPEMKTVKSKSKPVRYSLRRPGFIYRKRDLSRTTFLDNNLWEFTCGRRVLKTPSFKYRQKRNSKLSPYSTQILESLNKLTLDPKSARRKHNTSPNFEQSQGQSRPKVNANGYQFLSLAKYSKVNSTNTKATALPGVSKRVIKPGKLSNIISEQNLIHTAKATAENPAKPFCWLAAATPSSFSELSVKSDPVPTPKSFGMMHHNSPDFSSHNNTSSNPDDPFPTAEASLSTPLKPQPNIERSCSFQARMCEQDMSVDELSLYMEDFLFLPQKMSTMAEMMYT